VCELADRLQHPMDNVAVVDPFVLPKQLFDLEEAGQDDSSD
jgi:hypothetical protein